MCGRINVSADPLAELYLELLDTPFTAEDRFNVAPTEQVGVIRRGDSGDLTVDNMRWWLTPYWSKEVSTRYSMFNAKAETLTESRAYREPFKRRRCIVPVSGFYEWVREGTHKLPYYIRPGLNDGLLLAGLWDRWRDPETDGALESVTIITTAVNAKLSFVHKRQPVMLARENIDAWLADDTAPDTLQSLLRGELHQPMSVIPVSTYVGNSRNQGPRCIEPIGTMIELEPDA